MSYKKEEKITIFVVTMTAFITSFTGSALNLAIPAIGEYFSVTAALTGWIVTGYTITVAICSIPSGRIADLIGRKKVLVTGLIIFCASSAASVFSMSAWMLIILRGLQGIGAAMIFSTNTAILAEAFSEAERGKVLGYSLAATYIGLSVGPFLGGVLNHNLGWKSIFIVTAIFTLVILFTCRKHLPGSDKKLDAKLSIKSLIKLDVFKHNPAYICSSLAALINYGATFIVSYLLSIYLQVVMGYSSQIAGFILLVQPVVISILSPLAGKISDSNSPFKIAALGMAICTAGLAGCIFLDQLGGLWPIITILAIVGIGSALFSTPNTNAVMSCVDKKDYGIASSMLSTMRALGNTLSMLVVTAVSSIYIGSKELKQAEPEMIVKTMTTVFIISSVACVIGIFLARKKRK